MTSLNMWYLILAISLGSGFSFTIVDQENPKANERSIRDLKRRYWGDDVQPCIVKYCIKYVDDAYYWKCLSKFCPAGLLITEHRVRDISDDDMHDAAPMRHIAESLCRKSNGGHPGFLHLLTKKPHPERSSPTAADTSAILEDIRFALCSIQACSGLSAWSEEHLSCMAGNCCEKPSGAGRHRVAIVSHSPPPSKRRINDDMSQCIQSYCNGKQSLYRVMCIVKFCNRIKRF